MKTSMLTKKVLRRGFILIIMSSLMVACGKKNVAKNQAAGINTNGLGSPVGGGVSTQQALQQVLNQTQCQSGGQPMRTPMVYRGQKSQQGYTTLSGNFGAAVQGLYGNMYVGKTGYGDIMTYTELGGGNVEIAMYYCQDSYINQQTLQYGYVGKQIAFGTIAKAASYTCTLNEVTAASVSVSGLNNMYGQPIVQYFSAIDITNGGQTQCF